MYQTLWTKLNVNKIKLKISEETFTNNITLSTEVLRFFLNRDLVRGERFEISLIFQDVRYNSCIERNTTNRPMIELTGGFRRILSTYIEKHKCEGIVFDKINNTTYEVTLVKENVEEEIVVNETVSTEEIEVNTSLIIKKTIINETDELNRIISKLSISSKEMVASGNQELDDFNEYLHVKKPIEEILIKKIDEVLNANHNQLLLLVGNVGDGKSHLLSYFNKKYPDKMNQFHVHNDATESFDPSKDSIETLQEHIFDKLENGSNQKIILAINLGVLSNFILRCSEIYPQFTSYIQKSGVLEKTHQDILGQSVYHIVSFSDYKMFELTNEGPKSYFITTLMNKIFDMTEENPFYNAYLKSSKETIISKNYQLLMHNPTIRENVVQLIIRALIENKKMLSTRELLDFIYVMLSNEDDLQNTLFESQNLNSELMTLTRKYDPLLERSIDDELKFINESKVNKVKESKLKSEYRLERIQSENYMINKSYLKFMKILYEYFSGNILSIGQFSTNTIKCIRLWNGDAKEGRIFIDTMLGNYKIAVPYELRSVRKAGIQSRSMDNEDVEKFNYSFDLLYEVGGKKVTLAVDIHLFVLIEKMSNFYRPTKIDRESAILFIETVDEITKKLNETAKEVILYNRDTLEELIIEDSWDTLVLR